jgi:transcriptional regulator with XRE-family HTH domain
MKLRGLRHARQKSGLSLGQLSELTGLRRDVIADLEHGRGDPQPYVLHRLAVALGINQSSLVGTDADSSEHPSFSSLAEV